VSKKSKRSRCNKEVQALVDLLDSTDNQDAPTIDDFVDPCDRKNPLGLPKFIHRNLIFNKYEYLKNLL